MFAPAGSHDDTRADRVANAGKTTGSSRSRPALPAVNVPKPARHIRAVRMRSVQPRQLPSGVCRSVIEDRSASTYPSSHQPLFDHHRVLAIAQSGRPRQRASRFAARAASGHAARQARKIPVVAGNSAGPRRAALARHTRGGMPAASRWTGWWRALRRHRGRNVAFDTPNIEALV